MLRVLLVKIRRHATSGWTREHIGSGRFRITPTDESGPRIVEFLSRGTWQNVPGDDRANIDKDRVVLIEGAALPPWAMEWLTNVNARECERARESFRAAMDDADDAPFRDGGW